MNRTAFLPLRTEAKLPARAESVFLPELSEFCRTGYGHLASKAEAPLLTDSEEFLECAFVPKGQKTRNSDPLERMARSEPAQAVPKDFLWYIGGDTDAFEVHPKSLTATTTGDSHLMSVNLRDAKRPW